MTDKRRIPEGIREGIIAAWREGKMTQAQIADHFGVKPSTAYSYKPSGIQERGRRASTPIHNIDVSWSADPDRCVSKPQPVIEGSEIRPLTPQELMVGRASTGRRRLIEAP